MSGDSPELPEYTMEYQGKELRFASLADYVIETMYRDGRPPTTLVKVECADDRELCGRVFDVPAVGAVLVGKRLPRGAMPEVRDREIARLGELASDRWEWDHLRYYKQVVLERDGQPSRQIADSLLACVRHGHEVEVANNVLRRAAASGRQRKRVVTVLAKRSAVL